MRLDGDAQSVFRQQMAISYTSWLLVWALLFIHVAVATPSTMRDTCSSGLYTERDETSEQQFIVRFREYRPAAQWKERLENALGTSWRQWKWVERDNAAAPYPTDFGVLRVHDRVTHTIQERLREVQFVKDVHPDRVMHRNLHLYDTDVPSKDDPNRGKVYKPPGRFRTRPTFGLDSDEDDYTYGSSDAKQEFRRKLMYGRSHSVTNVLGAEQIWALGYSGHNIRVGVFDTGIRSNHPHVKNIKERTNWTHQPTLSDGLGHGSFVAGVIAGRNEACLGFAPDVDLFTFKVFTDDQVSYTSWFLDAFNYAILTKMHIVNLSIGGPDYLDHPFVEKVLEVTSSGIIMLSAIGNDGPLYGTLNNPADQNDVIGIGGITYDDQMARFSSRGMSTWELPLGYGRIKPDVLAYAQDVSGSKMQTGCRSLSGTSVASPVAAGAVALLASTVPEEDRWKLLNPASMKQALVEGATRLSGDVIYVQGAGKIDLSSTMSILQSYQPRASLVPGVLDLTDCPYMWPFCTQPLYANAVPAIINATVLNGLGVTGVLESSPVFFPSNKGGELLRMEFEYSDVLWPWSGYLAIYTRVSGAGREFKGVATGEIQFTVVSPGGLGEDSEQRSIVKVPFKAEIIPTPPREKRILWDQFHSIKYPPGYFPRDNLDVQRDILDWHGDHPHTNFHEMYDYLQDHGYYLEILGSPFTCFNASQYGALMIVDSEDVFYPEEIAKLEADVREEGLGLIVFAEWYNAQTAESYRFYDDNTRSWWTPVTGGGNIPGLNELLGEFDIAFGDAVLKGRQNLDSHYVQYASGSNIIGFPAGGYLHTFDLEDISGHQSHSESFMVLGLTSHGEGRVAVYGDSNCLDSSYQADECHFLLQAMLDYIHGITENQLVTELTADAKRIEIALKAETLPEPIDMEAFSELSFVLTHPLQCYKNAPIVDEADGEGLRMEETPEEILPEAVDSGRRVTDLLGEKRMPFEATNVGDGVSFVSTQSATQGSIDWGPPLIPSKWSALFGIIIMFCLYRMTRRRRQSHPTTARSIEMT